MEITATPPHITAFERFNVDAGTTACKRFLPEQALDSFPVLLSAMSHALNTNSDALHLQVLDLLLSLD